MVPSTRPVQDCACQHSVMGGYRKREKAPGTLLLRSYRQIMVDRGLGPTRSHYSKDLWPVSGPFGEGEASSSVGST